MVKKAQLHPRNIHNNGYDFNVLLAAEPTLSDFLFNNIKANNEQLTLNFADPVAVKKLNTALLSHYYQIKHWDIPTGYLCPPIPGRVDYIHYLADLLKASNDNKPVTNRQVKVLDIGTGAGCIYPILGQRVYGWDFVASDINEVSITMANKIIAHNDKLPEHIECRMQDNPTFIFNNIIKPDEYFDLTMCNPPFHRSLSDAQAGSQHKWQNLHGNKKINTSLNFGGQKAELWCPGGELAFIKKMITESKNFSTQVLWFSSLVSKKDNLSAIKLALKKAQITNIKVVQMAQGNKISRFVAWSFLNEAQQLLWSEKRLLIKTR